MHCVECRCISRELGRGWVAYRCDDPDPDQPDDGRPIIAFYCPACATREFGYRPEVGSIYVCTWDDPPRELGAESGSRSSSSAAPLPPPEHVGLEPARTFSVTMVRPGVMPTFETGAYEYFGRGLPLVGETILLRRTEGPEAGEVLQAYVTRVNPSSKTPIAVTEIPHGADQLAHP